MGKPPYWDKEWLENELKTKNAPTIAKELGVYKHVINEWIRKHGIKYKHTRTKDLKNIKYSERVVYSQITDKEKEWIYVILNCKKCGRDHVLKKLYRNFSCKCGTKLILHNSINYLSSNVIYYNNDFKINKHRGVYKE